MNFEDLLYLDPEFLSEKYEEKTGVPPNTMHSRNEGMKAGIGAYFLKSELHSQLTKQYSTSIQTMFKASQKLLEEYPCEPLELTPGIKPQNLWITGKLTVGHWKKKEGVEIPDDKRNTFFEIDSNGVTYALLPQNEYFRGNVDTLTIITPALQRFIDIPVKALCKVLYPLPDIATFVATPYIITANQRVEPTVKTPVD
ncbi:hypothetical protein P4E94_19350 [Pontiellaceae bacterium B12219]|nr:hypothetical protein [Pontiellaceae bacterium B12219]